MKCPYCGAERTVTHICDGLRVAAGRAPAGVSGLGDLPPDYGRFRSNPKAPRAGPMPGQLLPWFYFGSAVVTAGSTSTFVTTNQAADAEGLILGFQYYIDSEDYQTSPVSVVLTSVNSGSVAKTVFDPIHGPVGRGKGASDWFWFPEPYGIFFKKDQVAGLQVKNNEAVSMYVEGRIFGVTWPSSERPAYIESFLGKG